jgi:hypothetical protein
VPISEDVRNGSSLGYFIRPKIPFIRGTFGERYTLTSFTGFTPFVFVVTSIVAVGSVFISIFSTGASNGNGCGIPITGLMS